MQFFFVSSNLERDKILIYSKTEVSQKNTLYKMKGKP